MDNDLEKKFFDTFGMTYRCRFQYPEITDTMYIDLMHLFVKGGRYNIRVQDDKKGNRIRETLLQLFIDNSKDKRLMVDVQRYFEEQA